MSSFSLFCVFVFFLSFSCSLIITNGAFVMRIGRWWIVQQPDFRSFTQVLCEFFLLLLFCFVYAFHNKCVYSLQVKRNESSKEYQRQACMSKYTTNRQQGLQTQVIPTHPLLTSTIPTMLFSVPWYLMGFLTPQLLESHSAWRTILPFSISRFSQFH